MPYGNRHSVLEADLLVSDDLTSKQAAEFFRVFCGSTSSFHEFSLKHELKARGSRLKASNQIINATNPAPTELGRALLAGPQAHDVFSSG